MNKLLIISVSAGAGHVRAGEALKKTAECKYPNIEAVHIDMMDYVTLPVRRAIVDSYDLLVKQAPELWGLIYDKTNNPKRVKRLNKLSKLVNRINATSLYEYVEKFKPDSIICTHFLPANALVEVPAKYTINCLKSIVMTDYDKHALLLAPKLEYYFVATEKMQWKMIQHGIKKEHIINTGIPVDPVFNTQKDQKKLREKLNIDLNEKVILVLSGGQGMGKADDIVKGLFKISQKTTIIAIAGKNKKLEKRLKQLDLPKHLPLKIIGWTNSIDEYMRISEVVITKPGGMTTTECIALNKPIIAIHPIPGQEQANALHIIENNYGKIALSYEDISYYADKYISKSISIKDKIEKKPAAEQILETVLE